MRQFVEWFGFPSILTWSSDIFLYILDLSMSMFFLCLQYLTVRRWRSQFAVSNAQFFFLTLGSQFLIGLRLLYSTPSIVWRSCLLRPSLFFSISLRESLVFGLLHAGVF